MLARTLDELVVYRKSLDACAAVSEILERPKVRALREVPVYRARLVQRNAGTPGYSHGRKYLTDAELRELSDKYEEIARMLTGLIKYLRISDRKHRG